MLHPMKIQAIALITLSFIALPNAHSSYKMGSQCDLTDQTVDETWQKISEFKLHTYDENKIESLSGTVKAQILVTAIKFAEYISVPAPSNAIEAVVFLKDHSSSHDVYLQYISFNQKFFIQVVAYPGGNSFGAVFYLDSEKALASIQDDEIVCE